VGGEAGEEVGPLALVPLRARAPARAIGDPFRPRAVAVGGRRLRVVAVLSRSLVEGEWWLGRGERAVLLRLVVEGGGVVTAIAPLEEA